MENSTKAKYTMHKKKKRFCIVHWCNTSSRNTAPEALPQQRASGCWDVIEQKEKKPKQNKHRQNAEENVQMTHVKRMHVSAKERKSNETKKNRRQKMMRNGTQPLKKKQAGRQTCKQRNNQTIKTNASLRMFGKSNHMRHKTVVKRIVIVNTHAFKTLT